ncbi:unnamed protein product [Diatraea saccharalis]|uniref:Uncharacterized protein n=1 Tax=Diatraea saccharalis TaxID=40085 RepID=A0A9N9R6B9_9NEOP|nr:unnamed protein product [Diatraea saccharalis]
MPLQRSPSYSSSPAGSRVQSEPDIPLKVGQDIDNSFVCVRNKRLRTESPEDNDRFSDFKNEIKSLLTSWKSEQDSILTSWKSDQDSMLKKLTSDVGEVKLTCSNIQKCNQELEKSLEFVSKQFEDMRTRTKKLEKDKKENQACILSLEAKIQELQRMSRSAAVEVRNIPQKDRESTADLTRIMSGIGKALNLSLQPGDLRDMYRGPGKPGTNRNIVVEFNGVQMKYDLLTSVRNFNRSRKPEDKLNTQLIGLTSGRTPIYIDEHLSAYYFYLC